MKKAFNFIIACMIWTNCLMAQQAVGYIDSWWKPNGPVNSIIQYSNKIYLGGNFTYLGPSNSYGTLIDKTNFSPSSNYTHPNGFVYVNIPDGMGGWYIGGSFSSIGGVPRNNVARINADGTLHPWNPNANNSVKSICSIGGKIYMGGYFTTMGGQQRNYIAAVDTLSGNLLSWNPNPNQYVTQLIEDAGLIYVAGKFNTIGGQIRNHLAALDTSTGAATFWSPNPDSTVSSIAISGNNLYVGGRFSNIGGQSRLFFASINKLTGFANTLNPTLNNEVLNIFIDNNSVYLCGMFTNVNSQARRYLASINISSGMLSNWNPNPNNLVYSMAFDNNTIYIGGQFDSIVGQKRTYLAALANTSTASLSTTNQIVDGSTNNYVMSLSLSNNNIYVGGSFKSIGGVFRNRLASFDINTGMITSWNPSANTIVYALNSYGDRIYIGGNFNKIGDSTRKGIAAVDTLSGSVLPWKTTFGLGSNYLVKTILSVKNKVYIGGDFTIVGGQTRNRLAALDSITGLATNWNPISNNIINTLTLIGNKIFLGGSFNTINGISRNNIASVDTLNGITTNWNPNANDEVNTICSFNNKIYIGGNFTSVGGQTRYRIACVDTITGTVNSWNPNANSNIYKIVYNNNKLYLGGAFSILTNEFRSRIASLDINSNLTFGWNPNASSSVNDIITNGNKIFIGGNFTSINNDIDRRYFIPLIDSSQYYAPTITSFSPNNACSGGSVTITGTNFQNAMQVFFGGIPASSFTINSPTSITATVGNGGNGLVTVVTPYGPGTSIDSFFLNPQATIISNTDTLFCNVSSISLNANIGLGYTYQWILNGSVVNGATNSSFNATIPGSYTVVVTNNNNCVATSQPKIINYILPPTANIISPDSTFYCSGQSVVLTGNTCSSCSYQWCNNGNIIPGATSTNDTVNVIGNYTLIITDTFGCVDTSTSIFVSEIPSPVVTVTPSGTIYLCNGANVTLTASTIGTNLKYLWYKYGTPQQNEIFDTLITNLPGIYVITVTDTIHNCTTNSLPVTISHNPFNVVNIYQNGDTLKSTNSYISYQWYKWNSVTIPGATNSYYIPTQTDIYYLIVTDSTNCSHQSNVYSFFLDVNEFSKKYIKFYPNPAINSITIEYLGSGEIIISELTGRVLIKQLLNANKNTETINIGHLTSGVYMIQYKQTDGRIVTQKFIKQ